MAIWLAETRIERIREGTKGSLSRGTTPWRSQAGATRGLSRSMQMIRHRATGTALRNI